ncbi:MAG: FAD-dependent monooxygenase [Hyphomicrobiaceae bacterium]
MSSRLRIAVLGAGMGGLTAAALLDRLGFQVKVYEQASGFTRLGAGIQMSPNAMRVLRGLGVGARISETAFRPGSWRNRTWDTGELFHELPLGDAAQSKYGAPYLLMHRGDLHEALLSCVRPELIESGRKLVDLDRPGPASIVLRFEDGSRAEVDALIAADGVHSRVREILQGEERPSYTGMVAYRTTFPAHLLRGAQIDDYCKWWGKDRHIVIYFVTAERDEVYFVTAVPEPDWTVESWSSTGSVKDLQAAFAGFHPDVQAVVHACPSVHKWAILTREPLPSWGEGRVVLLGDSCHPMTPWMAQGAATAMEDAVVLSRCLDDAKPESGEAVAAVFERYAMLRRPRTAQIQRTSHANTWMRGATPADWVYAYDPWSAPLSQATGTP